MNLQIEVEETRPEFHPEFRVDSVEAANWFLRKLASIEAEKARVQAQAAKMVAEMEADAETLRRLYESEAVDFARRTLAEAGRGRRTLHLLQGSIALRAVPASVRVADPFAALDYCQQAAPHLIRRTEAIDPQAYQRMAHTQLKETGELLPGVETTPAHETHKITFGERA